MINVALLVALTIVALCMFVGWIVVTTLNKVWPAHWRWLKVLLAGLIPTLIIVALLSVWHPYARIEYAKDPQEGFMSPLLMLLHGYPYILVNLAINFAVALYGSRKL